MSLSSPAGCLLTDNRIYVINAAGNHVGTVPARSGLSMGSAGAGAPRTRRRALGSSRTPAPCPKHCFPPSPSPDGTQGSVPAGSAPTDSSLTPQPYPGTTRAPLTPLSLEPASRTSSGPDLSPVAPQLGSLPPAPGQDPAPCPRSFIPGWSQTRTHSASATKPLTPKAKGKASREGASAPGTAGSCIPTATAAGSPDFGPKAGQRGSALKELEPPPAGRGSPQGGV